MSDWIKLTIQVLLLALAAIIGYGLASTGVLNLQSKVSATTFKLGEISKTWKSKAPKSTIA
jgi:hypothetical protein